MQGVRAFRGDLARDDGDAEALGRELGDEPGVACLEGDMGGGAVCSGSRPAWPCCWSGSPPASSSGHRARPPGGFDWSGLILATSGIALLAVGVIEGQTLGWTDPLVLTAFLVCAVALVGFVIAARRRAHPLIDVSLFARPAFTAASTAAFVVFFAYVGAIVYLSAYFQQVQNHSAIEAGVDVIAIGVACAIAASASGRPVGRFGERAPLIAGLPISGGSMLGLLRLAPHTGIGEIWWNFALLGAGIGLAGTPMSTIAMSAVDASRAGMASAVLNATRQIGQVFGVAVLGALIYAQFPHGAAGGPLTSAQQTLFVSGLNRAMLV